MERPADAVPLLGYMGAALAPFEHPQHTAKQRSMALNWLMLDPKGQMEPLQGASLWCPFALSKCELMMMLLLLLFCVS